MPRSRRDEDILATARKRFELCEDAEQEIRREAIDDLRACAGEQWDARDRQIREATGANRRPCLTINKLIGPLDQTANEARMNQAGILVSPMNSETERLDTAQVIEGLIRHIEYVSKADEVYVSAIEHSTACGFGYFRVVTRYCSDKSFDQELRIERVNDPFSIYIDPYAQEANKSDMQFAFETEWVDREEYEDEYNESEITRMNFWDNSYIPVPGWVTKTGVRIARYWTVETTTRQLGALDWPDGTRTTRYADEIGDEADLPGGVRIATDGNGRPIRRETEERRIKCYKINGVEILDETDWPGQYIPILPVLGKEFIVDGKRKLFSLIRFAKDAQRLYNFYRSSEAETVLLGTKAPWIGAKGIFKDTRWATANAVNWAYIEYEPLDLAGNPAQPPQRNIFEPPIQALSLGAAQAADDIKATTGIYDASLGAQGNETSGVAIRQRQSQAGMANAHFIDNLNRAIRHCGVILCDLIPKIYDAPREIRILGEDRAQQIVMVNQVFRDWQGKDKCYSLQSGQYDVAITVGPSYTTQRQQSWDIMTQLAQAYPQLVQVAGDLMFQNADFPGAEEIATRLRKMLPPGLVDQPQSQQQQMQVLTAQAQQMGQTIDQLTQALNNAEERIRTRQVERESDERIEKMKIEAQDRHAALKSQTDIVTAAAKLQSGEDIVLLREQLRALERQIARMSSGVAADQSAVRPPAAPVAAPAGPVNQPAPPVSL